MKTVRFTPLHAVGGQLPEQSGSVIDLIEHFPYFLRARIPTKTVLNSILKIGTDEAGMSGGVIWEPFQLSDNEYRDVFKALKLRGLKVVEPPEWVETRSDWHIWEMEVDRGIPAEKHRRLNQTCERLEKEMELAEREGRKDDAYTLNMEFLKAEMVLSKFHDQYRDKR